jgi:hypothetical protein
MSLLKEIALQDQEMEVEGPSSPGKWSVGHMANHGIILSCDGFVLKLDLQELNKFLDIAEDGESGEIKDHNGKLILVEPTDDSIVLTRNGDETYPSGVVLDLETLEDLGIYKEEEEENLEEPDNEVNPENEDDKIEGVDEAVKAAFRRSGNKIKKGFRVTSGIRKGRVVANIKTAYKPRAKASTRMKLKIAARKKKVIRVLKSKRTRKKSISKRLVRMNQRRK